MSDQHPTAVTWGVGLICTHMVSYALRTNPSKSKYSNILGFKVTASCSLISNNNNNNQAYGAVSLNRIYHLLKSDSLTRSVFPTHAAIHTFRAVQSLYLCFASLQNKRFLLFGFFGQWPIFFHIPRSTGTIFFVAVSLAPQTNLICLNGEN
jgi:hypothetical protein